jgi:hypothetical protein
MYAKLRRFLLSWPMIAAVGAVVIYLAFGFLALPALLKWQLEKQVSERLGHPLKIAELHFNPLEFRLDVDGLALADPDGRPLFAFRHLLVDFELRSVIDGAWTFAQVRLEAPEAYPEMQADGTYNFSALLARLASDEPAPTDSRLPSIVVQRAELLQGRIEYADRLLDDPLVARVEPIELQAEDLATQSDKRGRYHLAARTSRDEAFDLQGELALHPFATQGQLAIEGFTIETLARALSRRIAIDKPQGTLSLAARFEFALDEYGAPTGVVRAVDFSAGGLSIGVAGDAAPLFAAQSLSLKQGRVDLGSRAAELPELQLSQGRASTALDDKGALNWSRLLRPGPAPASQAAPASAPESAAAAAPASARASGPWRIALPQARISDIAIDFADAAGGRRADVQAITAELSADVEVGPAALQVALAQPRLRLGGLGIEQPGQALSTAAASLEAGRLDIVVAGSRVDMTLDAPRLAAPEGSSIRLAEGGVDVTALSMQASRLELNAAQGGLKAAAGTPKVSADAVVWRTVASTSDRDEASAENADQLRKTAIAGGKTGAPQPRAAAQLELKRPTVGAGTLSFTSSEGRTELSGTAMTVTTATVVARPQPAVQLELERPTVGVAMLSVANTGGGTDLSGKSLTVSTATLVAQRDADRIALKDAGFEAQAFSAAAAAETSAAPGVDARIDGAALRLAALDVRALGSSQGLASVGAATVEAKALQLALPAGAPDVSGNGLGASLSDVVLKNPADSTELLRLGRATLAGGVLRLRERSARAEQLVLAGGRATGWLDSEGRLSWLSLLEGTVPAEAPSTPATANASAGTADVAGRDAAWRFALGSAQLDDFAFEFEDRRESPPLAVALESIRARVAGFETGSATPMNVEFDARLSSGGEIGARGTVRADNGAADLKLRVAALALAPVQPYLSRFATLRLATGTASAEGRLRQGDAASSGASLVYEGSASIDELKLDEVPSGRTFLAWQSVDSDDVVLTLGPDRLDIGELRIDGPDGRLIIAEDQTVNLTDVLKSPAPAAKDAAPQAEAKADAADAFAATVARVRVTGGVLEFADLSLRPQFRTRMHDLKGVITGLTTDASRSAAVQLDAQIDRYGSAKIRGQLSVLRPEQLTDIDMVFRNLEMKSLSPYVAKFAGYRIAGGRLALDLRYKVRERKLQGENKIVLNQVELGEKVDSPGALDVPLDLAIAILKDANGVIDIGLPVSGDLGDPKFDYGAVIGKAVAGMLGGVVTAPFRALGAAFGGGGRKLDSIDFEPGQDGLAPPEREKLETIARALKDRPALKLVVPPTYDGTLDGPALKSLAVRGDIVRRMGVALAPGEDPGALDVANPRVQQAVEGAFAEQYAPEVLAALKQRAAPEAATPAASAPPGNADAKQTKAAVLPAAFYQGLIDRLIAETAVPGQRFEQLATARGAAIVDELHAAQGVPAPQVVLGKMHETPPGGGSVVTLRLDLEAVE